MEQKIKIEYRYYEIPEKELVLALLGEEWVRSYGLDYLHFHNYMEVGICRHGKGEVLIEEQRYPFQDTQATIIPPNVPHEANSYGELAFWEWLYIDVAAVLEEMFPNDQLLARQIKQEVYKESTFTRNFKKVLDMTPYQWKRSAENNEGKTKDLRMTAQKGW